MKIYYSTQIVSKKNYNALKINNRVHWKFKQIIPRE